MKTLFAFFMFACVFVQGLESRCLSQLAQDHSQPRLNSSPAPFRIGAKHLPNAIQIQSKVISGGQPEGEQAFRELQHLGVKTIVSVDGAKPQLELAKKYGLRYVHLPHGYDGIGVERSAELAKAVRDLEGPIYIHCHHGQHRSPAAAAVACISIGWVEPESALGILKLAGTNSDYRGLFAAVTGAHRIDDAVLDAMRVDFLEIAKLPPLAEAMVDLDGTYNRMKKVVNATETRTLPNQKSDLAHDALLMREHFKEMMRLESVSKQADAFRGMLKESEADAQILETEIRHWTRHASAGPVPRSVSNALERIRVNCSACHRQYRDSAR